ncbi:MAG: M48 family metallopeptidase [Tistlia sp.]|uniref:M48 family metallopeptidase n=1 Tax=Tistlia sp. TaxID=3057121 RepID=UPI0034A4DF76
MCNRLMDRRKLIRGLAAGSVIAFAGATSGCTQSEMLGRDQLLLVSNDQLAQLAAGTWKRTLDQEGVVNNRAYDERLTRVAGRIVTAAGRGDESWEFAVIQDDSLNAFALPGNKIGVNGGMMDFVQNDDQLAAIIGHEIAHVAAQHSAERYSQQMVSQIGMNVASAAMAASNTPAANEIAAVLGAGLNFGVILPYSRRHELEADSLGVQYMARAGYDPREAIAFWRRMTEEQGRSQQPEFMSTHPADQTRIDNLQEQIRRLG